MLTTISLNEVATAVVKRLRAQMPCDSATTESVPTEVLAALVQEIADTARVALVTGWARVVAQETSRRETVTEQQRDVGVQWNQRSRPVAVLGAPGMGFGENVLPYLRRSAEGLAVHATSHELRRACRRRTSSKWPSAEV
jgi:hypothetical protein